MALTVSQVSRLAGVSVRALHHYDEIGLMRPSGRSDAGYRLYEQDDLQRLQQVLFFRELGFSLEEIGRILGDPSFDLRDALLMQRELLEERAVRLRALISTVNATLESLEKGTTMTKEQMLEVFGDFDPSAHQEEVRERWGDTEAYRESARRTVRYGKREWQRIKEESGAIYQELADALDAGWAPEDPRALEIAEKHRRHIERWFYPCSREMHRGLGEMYVNDQRFTENIDRTRAGLAAYLCEVFRANAEKRE